MSTFKAKVHEQAEGNLQRQTLLTVYWQCFFNKYSTLTQKYKHQKKNVTNIWERSSSFFMGATGFHHYRPSTPSILSPFSKSDLRSKKGAVYIMSTLHNLRYTPVFFSLPSRVHPCFPQPGQSFLPRPRKTTPCFCKTKEKAVPFIWQTLMCSSLWSRSSPQVKQNVHFRHSRDTLLYSRSCYLRRKS